MTKYLNVTTKIVSANINYSFTIVAIALPSGSER